MDMQAWATEHTIAAMFWAQSEEDALQRLDRLGKAALVQSAGDGGYRLDGTAPEDAPQLLSEWTPLPEAHAQLLGRSHL